jgi:hypothetical protein
VPRVSGLLTAEPDRAELGVRERAESLGPDVAVQRRIEPVERRPSRRKRYLLFEDEMDERRERRLARPERGRAEPLDR